MTLQNIFLKNPASTFNVLFHFLSNPPTTTWLLRCFCCPDFGAVGSGRPAFSGCSDQQAPGPARTPPGVCGAGWRPGETPSRREGQCGGGRVSSGHKRQPPPLLWWQPGWSELCRGEGKDGGHSPFHTFHTLFSFLYSLFLLEFYLYCFFYSRLRVLSCFGWTTPLMLTLTSALSLNLEYGFTLHNQIWWCQQHKTNDGAFHYLWPKRWSWKWNSEWPKHPPVFVGAHVFRFELLV